MVTLKQLSKTLTVNFFLPVKAGKTWASKSNATTVKINYSELITT